MIAPGWVHSIMREMHIVFGYGNVADPEKVEKILEEREEGLSFALGCINGESHEIN